MLPLYKSLIRPLVEYATPVWNPQLKQDISEIERVQRKATKCMQGLRSLPYTERLRRLNLPSLQLRRSYYDLCICYSMLRGLVRSDCARLITLSETSTRGQHNLIRSLQPCPKYNVRKSFFIERVITMWNALPREITQLSSYSRFKLALRRHLRLSS